jgi:hypothetical protein
MRENGLLLVLFRALRVEVGGRLRFVILLTSSVYLLTLASKYELLAKAGLPDRSVAHN